MPRPKRRAPASRSAPATGRARRERSAGVVLYREVPDESGGFRRVFLLLDYGRHWDYPKGHVEPGEDDRAASLRELAEETGVTAATLLEGFSHEIVYHFHSSRKGLVRKEVIFFLARTDSDVIRLSEEHVGYAWLEKDAALQQLTFENARTVLRAAAEFLEGQPKS